MHNVVTGVSLQSPIEPNTLHFVSDDELLFRTRELARHETELTIVTIQYLDEIERRELYDERGYASLFEYAVRELHYSKGCAWRRLMVMKLCRAVPGIADKLRSGELNLTTASQLQNAIEKRARKAARNAARERASESVSESVGVPLAGAVSAGAEESASGEVQPVRPGVAGVAGVPGVPGGAGVTASAEHGASPDETEAARVAGKAAVAAPEAPAPAAASLPPGAARESAALPPAPEPPPAWTLDQKVELVDLVANKSARETEKLLAELEPEVGLPRERQRALGGGRYEVRMILDQDSVDTIAKLKGWLSHVNPGFTTGQLLAYLLQQAERKYDPMRERGGAKRAAAAPARHAETCEQHRGVTDERQATGSALGAAVSKADWSTCAPGAPGAGVGVPAPGAARGAVAAGSVAAGAPAPGSAAAGSANAGFPAPGPAAAGPRVALAGGSAQNPGTQRVAAPGSEQDRRNITGSAQNQQPPLVPDRSGERTPRHPAGSANAGFPAPGPAAAGPRVALAGGSAQNPRTQRVAAPGSEQDRRDTTGSAQNQQPPLVPDRSDERTPRHPAGSADAGFPAAGPTVALGSGSAQNRGTQRVAAPGSEQDRRDITGSAQNQRAPRAGNVRSRTDTEPHRGVRARLPGDGSAAPPPAAESTHACRARRHIPAAVKRAVWRRYGGACCYQDPLTGVTCGSTHLVQLDHIVPLAQGGSDDISNLRLRCAVHNRRRDPRCASYRSAPAGARGRSRCISTSSATTSS